MIDVGVLIREYLIGQTEVTALLGTNANGSIYVAYDLPEHFNPSLGPGIQIYRSGGHSHPEILPLVDARVMIRAWADVEEYTIASTLYSAINDVLHGLCGATLANGTIVRALEADGPMEMTDPETGWVAMYAFYQVMARPGVAGPQLYTPQFYEGDGPPVALENNDDIYYDELYGNVYEQVAGVWVLIGNIPPGGSPEMPSLTYHKVAASGTNAANIKATAGLVTGGGIFNDTEFPLYLKLFNKATPPVLGTDVPQQTIGVQAGETEPIPAPDGGVTYSAGISVAVTGGIADLDATTVTAGSCVYDVFYQ